MACMDVTNMPPPTIRLRIWHDGSFADTHVNEDLFGFLYDFDTEPWDVLLPGVLTKRHYGDQFVPVEVDFKYRPTSRYNLEQAVTSLLRVFAHGVDKYVNELFNSTAVFAHMYSVGEPVSEEIKSTFPLARSLRSLAMQSHRHVKSYPSVNHTLAAEALSLAVEIPSRVVGLKGMLAASDFTGLKDSIPSNLSSLHEVTVSKEAVEAWNRSLLKLEHVHTFSKSLKTCIEGLSGKEGVGPGVLWENLVRSRETLLQFSEYQKLSEKFIENLMSCHKAQAEEYRHMKATLVTAVSFILATAITNLYGSTDFTAAFASGPFSAGMFYLADFFFGKRKNAEKFVDAIANFAIALRKAQFALAILLSHRVLEMPFPLLAQRMGTDLLKELGVDFAHLKGEEYTEKFAMKCLKDLVRAYEDLDKMRDGIRKDAGLKEFLGATMASASPDGGEPMDFQKD